MNFLESSFHARAGDVVEVTLDGQANVRLLDDGNFARFRRGQSCQGVSGWAIRSPVRLEVPRAGHWHAVVDLGGRAGSVRASVEVLTAR